MNGENSNFIVDENILFNKDKTRMLYILPNAIANGQKVFTIPNTVTILSIGLIDQFSSINKVIIPAGLNNIGDFRFFPKRITEIEIDAGNNTYMSDGSAIYSKNGKILYMYYKVSNDMRIKDEVTNIGEMAFNNHNNVKSLSIGKNVSKINFSYAWSDVEKNLTSFTIDKDNKNYKIEGQGIYTIDAEGNLNAIVGTWGQGTQFDIPKGVKIIERHAFYGKSLTKVTIPDTVETIKEQAFALNSITEIKIPNSVKTISGTAFAHCNKLTKIEIDNEKGTILGSPWGCPIGERAIIWLR